MIAAARNRVINLPVSVTAAELAAIGAPTVEVFPERVHAAWRRVENLLAAPA
jgi:hypothetical protein